MPDVNIFQNEQRQPDGTLIISGTELLNIPAGGAHVRQTDVRLPFFEGTPTISIGVHALDEPSLAARLFGQHRETFVVYDVTFHEEQTYLGCKISATNIWNGVKSQRKYFCNYITQGRERAA